MPQGARDMKPSDCSTAELVTVYLATLMRDDDVGFTGMTNGDVSALYGTLIPLAAMSLAQRTHAPSLTILLGGWLHNPDLSRLPFIPDSEFQPDLRRLDCEAISVDLPSQYNVRRGDVTVGFSNGAQVDMWGNQNSVCIGDHDHPRVRLLGPVFQTEHLAFFGREMIMMGRHERRNFVEAVDYVSAVGFPGGEKGRRRLGLTVGSGPECVVTPLCIFDFDRAVGRMKVRSVHPGVAPDEVVARTGFDVGDLAMVPTTPLPDADYLRVLREEVDPQRMLLPRDLRQAAPPAGRS